MKFQDGDINLIFVSAWGKKKKFAVLHLEGLSIF